MPLLRGKHQQEGICTRCNSPSAPDHKYCQKHLSKARMRNFNRKMAAIEALGGVCTCCGEKNPEFLQIDHIDGGGGKHRREKKYSTSKLYYQIIKGTIEHKVRLLCANCNQSIAISPTGICAHTR